jgi:hypothetical protein
MNVSFEQAQAIVKQHLTVDLPNAYIADYGSSNETWWQINAGFEEFYKNGNSAYKIFDDTVYLVNKKTGVVKEAVSFIDTDLLSTLRPYGQAPQTKE